MVHFDEHTIELYVTGSDRVRDRQAAIEQHLAECATCRELADRMMAFYADLRANLSDAGNTRAGSSGAMVRSDHRLRPQYENDAYAVPLERYGTLANVQGFVRRHPIASSAGTFTLLAALAMLLNLALPSRAPDTNPAYPRLMPDRGLVEIRNAENLKLWDLSTSIIFSGFVDSDVDYLAKLVKIEDLDHDGTNEVISILKQGEDAYNQQLRIYDSRKNTILAMRFSEPFKYLDRSYTPNVDLGSILVDDVVEGGKPEIWPTGNSRGRSPGVTIRMDAKGNILGKYWHFGQLRDIYSMTLGPDRKKMIVLTGMNDTADSTEGEFPVIVVLDPEKVTGETRSTLSPGFAFPASDAELYYIALPASDMNAVVHYKPGAPSLMDTASTLMQFRLSTRLDEDHSRWFEFDFFFDRDMNIQEVKSNNHTDAVRDSFVKQDRLGGSIGRAYLEDLRDRVRYWDGSEWRKEPVRVQQGVRLAKK
jgi:hypothetical protein